MAEGVDVTHVFNLVTSLRHVRVIHVQPLTARRRHRVASASRSTRGDVIREERASRDVATQQLLGQSAAAHQRLLSERERRQSARLPVRTLP